MSARNDHPNDHGPVAHSDPEAAAELSEDVKQKILDMHRDEPDYTAADISQVLDGEDAIKVSAEAIQAVLLADSGQDAG